MKILISGPQGSGKTTQAIKICQKFGFCLVKTGHLVREFAQLDGPEALEVRRVLTTGDIASDKIVAGLVREKLDQSECQAGFVMDGYPRRLSQLEVFDPHFDLVFCLQISDEEAKKRLLERGRADDTLAVIEKRVALYHEETEKVLDYYRKLGILIDIDGELGPAEVTKQIARIIKARQ